MIIRLRSPNVDQMKQVLGFSPQVSLEQGLEQTIAWYREHLSDFARGK